MMVYEEFDGLRFGDLRRRMKLAGLGADFDRRIGTGAVACSQTATIPDCSARRPSSGTSRSSGEPAEMRPAVQAGHRCSLC